MGIDRKIRLFFVTYGRLLFICIAIFLLIIFVIQSLDNYVAQQNEGNKLTYEEQIALQQKQDEKKQEREYISKFIDYCNTGKIDEAYSMLSETCKKEKYSTIEKFKSQYINKMFNVYICSYKIKKDDNIYRVILTEDMLVTGKSNSNKETALKIDNILETRIYICD